MLTEHAILTMSLYYILYYKLWTISMSMLYTAGYYDLCVLQNIKGPQVTMLRILVEFATQAMSHNCSLNAVA